MHGSQRGFSVVLVVVVLLLISVYSSVGMKLIAARSEMSSGVQQSEQAFYLAESGLATAIKQLKTDWSSWDDPELFPETNFAHGIYDATISTNYMPSGYGYAGNYGYPSDSGTSTGFGSSYIPSSGSSSGGSQSLTQEYDPAVEQTAFQQTIGNNDAIYKGDSISQSFTQSNESSSAQTSEDPDEVTITVKGKEGSSTRYVQARMSRWGNTMNHAVYSTQVVSVGEQSVILGGDVQQQAGSFPPIDEAQAIAMARANSDNGFGGRADGNYFQGGFPEGQDPSTLNGVVFIDVAADGSNAWLNLNNVSTTSYDSAVLIVKGNVTFSGSSSFRGLVYVVGGSAVGIDDSSSIFGAVYTTNMSSHVGNNASIYYAQSYVLTSTTKQLLQGIEDPHVISWKEYYQ